MIFPVKRLADLGFEILATEGTAEVLRRNGVDATVVRKHYQADDGTPDTVAQILAGEVDLIVNTPFGTGAPARRLRDPHRRGHPRRPVHHDGPGARRGRAGHRGADPGRDRRTVAAGVRRRPERGSRAPTAQRDPRPRRGPDARAGARRGPRHPPGRRLPRDDARGARHRRADPARPVRRARRRRARHARCCCAARSRSTGCRSAASTAAPSRSSSRSRAGAPRGSPAPSATRRSTSSARSAARSRCPKEPVGCVLVGGGYGTAPLFALAEQLRARGCRVDFVLGAATEDRLFGALEAKRMAQSIAVTTDDGSLGERGRVTDVLPGDARAQRRATSSTPAARWRCCGRSARSPTAHGAHSQTAVEESMACGIGVCMTCVLPVDRRRRRDPHGALVRRGSGVRRRPRALGRRRHRARRRARRAAPRPRRPATRRSGRRSRS